MHHCSNSSLRLVASQNGSVSSVAGGFLVFGDQLGRTAPLAALHLVAFCLVFVAAWLLAPVQAALQEGATAQA